MDFTINKEYYEIKSDLKGISNNYKYLEVQKILNKINKKLNIVNYQMFCNLLQIKPVSFDYCIKQLQQYMIENKETKIVQILAGNKKSRFSKCFKKFVNTQFIIKYRGEKNDNKMAKSKRLDSIF